MCTARAAFVICSASAGRTIVESKVNVSREVGWSSGMSRLRASGSPSVVSRANGVKRKRGRPPSDGAVAYRYHPPGDHSNEATSRSSELVRIRGCERPSRAKRASSTCSSLLGDRACSRKATVFPSVVTVGAVRAWSSIRSRRWSWLRLRSATYKLRCRTRSGERSVGGIPLTTTWPPPGSQSACPYER